MTLDCTVFLIRIIFYSVCGSSGVSEILILGVFFFFNYILDDKNVDIVFP